MAETRIHERLLELPNRQNLLGNGGFEIWQRGAGPWTVHGNYTADLWRMEKDGANTLTVSRDATEAHFGYYSLKAIFAISGGTYGQLESEQALNWTGQSTWVTKITGQKFSLSAWVRCSTAAAVKIRIKYSGATPFADSAYHTGSGNWEQLTVTGTYPSTGTMLGVSLWFDASATAWFDEVMLVVGGEPVDYMPLHISEQQERCQRWYWITNRWVAQFYAPVALAGHMWWYPFPTTMRFTPTITQPGGATTNFSAGGVIDINTKSWNFWMRGVNAGTTTFVMDAGSPGNVIMEVT